MNSLGRNTKITTISLILLVAVVVSIILWPSGPSKPSVIPQGDYSYAIDYLNYQVNKLMDKYGLPSVCVAMIDDQSVVFKQAYGIADIEKDLPATLDTIYKMGSISKLFTGIEVMRMYEEGLIDLDAPITDYLPDFSINSNFPYSEPITIRSILAHRSGLPRNSTLLGWYWEARPDVLKAQVDSLAETYQAFPVGYRYKYSNIGYNLLGRLIEVVRGIVPTVQDSAGGWPYYMKDEVLKPLGMEDSAFGSDMLLWGKEPELDVAMGYYWEDDVRKPHNQFDIIELASGSFQSTMNDMVRFVQYLFRIGEMKKETIISKDTLWSMFEDQCSRPRDPQPQGLAWFTDSKLLGEQVVLHTGTNQGFKSIITLLPEKKLGFIAISNGTRFEDHQNQLAFNMLGLMLETSYGIVPEQNDLTEVDVPRNILERYTGTYIINDEIIEIILSSNQLKAVYQGQKINMVPVGQSSFSLNHWMVDLEDVEIEFFVDDPSDEDIMIVYMGDYFVCPRYTSVETVPVLWQELTGTYDLYARTPSVYSDEGLMGTVEIKVEDGILMISDGKYLKMLSDTEIRIVGGIFDGEMMVYDAETGSITWQNLIYRPKEKLSK